MSEKNFFFTNEPVIFKDKKEIKGYEGRYWYIQKLLPHNSAILITEENDITAEVDLNAIEPNITIFDYGIYKTQDGLPFKIDLAKHTLKIGNKTFIDGKKHILPLEYNKDRTTRISCYSETRQNEEIKDTPDILNKIESLYDKYRHSIPSEKDTHHPSKYFIALKEEDLSDDDMLYGEKRNLAQFRLECYILCEILKGTLTKEIFGDKWFWQSAKHPDLILLKSWFNLSASPV